MDEQNPRKVTETGSKVVRAQQVRKGHKVGPTPESKPWAIMNEHWKRAVVKGVIISDQKMHFASCADR